MSKIPPDTLSRFYTEVVRHRPKHVFVTFVTKLKMEDHVSLFPFVFSPWRNCPKIEGHHLIEMLHSNFPEMLFNIKFAVFKYPYFCNIFNLINNKYTENIVAYVTRSGNC